MANEFDHEVLELASLLNEIDSKTNANVLQATDSILHDAQINFKPLLGGIDWERAVLVSSTQPIVDETLNERRKRNLREFDQFVVVLKLDEDDKAIVISDDFYSIGIQCRIKGVRTVLDKWIGLPHAILVFDESFWKCFHVSFVGCTYMGHAVELPSLS